MIRNLETKKTETGIKKIAYHPSRRDCHEADCDCHPEGFTEPKENGILVDAETLNSIVQQAVNDAVGKLTLDNPIKMEVGMSGGKDMPHRTRVMIGTHDNGEPIYKQIQAQNIDALNDRIVQEYIDSGRIHEFLSAGETQKNRTRTLFKPFAEEFRARFKAPKLKPRTLQQYDFVLSNKLMPAFGEKYIEEITTADIQDFLNRNHTASEKTLKNFLTILKPILRYAVERDIIPKNPADSMTLFIPSRVKNVRKTLTSEQFAEVLASIRGMKDGPEKLAISIIAYTGCRRGEMLGLQWEDIDFDHNLIHVRRSIKHLHNQPLLEDMSTKTKSGVRDIPFGEELAALLRPMRSKGYLLGGDTPLTATRYQTIRQRISKSVELYGVTEHGLRHTYLTLAQGEGVDLKTLQTIAGHSDSHTTMQVYVHAQAGKIKEAGDRMDSLLHNLAENGVNMQKGAA